MNCATPIPICNVSAATLANMTKSCAAIATNVTGYTSCDGVHLTLTPIANPAMGTTRTIVMGVDPC